MATLFEHVNVKRCVVGTVGEPGERSFFLQVSSAGVESFNSINTLAIEKSQVLALVERLKFLILELSQGKERVFKESASRDDLPLTVPLEVDFHVGNMAVMWLSEKEVIQIELQELRNFDLSELASSAVDETLSMVRIQLTLPLTVEFIRRTTDVANSGRPACIYCNLPINPDGHLCPRANGYRR